MKAPWLAMILLLVCTGTAPCADSTIVDTSVTQDTILYVPQELGNVSLGVTDSVDYEKKLYQNPTLALFKSMLVPGLGQIGNRQYIKAGVIIGLQSWLISSAIKHGREASDWRRQFNASDSIGERNLLYENYLDSKDQRNKFTWFAVIVTFVSMFDAFSDAHLSGFPKDPEEHTQNINLKIKPSLGKGWDARITYSF